MAEWNRNKHAANFKDLIGLRFGRFTVLGLAEGDTRHLKWHCLCDCGSRLIVDGGNMTTGRTKSCGCLRSESSASRGYINDVERRAHGAWAGAKQRCFNPKSINFHRYGGRGITMCDKWSKSFSEFLSDMGPCPDGMTLERKNNDGNYEPGNCIWIPAARQARNRRDTIRITHNGKTQTLKEWAEQTGIPYACLQQRLYGKSSVPLFDPVKK